MNKILITTSSFGKHSDIPIKKLENEGFTIVMNPFGRKLSLDESLQLYGKDVAGVIAGTELIDKAVLESAGSLKVISRCGVGVDNIDLAAAKEMNIHVCNTPNGPTLAVAELTLGLILNLLRKVNFQDSELKAGKWNKLMGNLLFKKKVGIIGFGRIGQKVAELLLPFGTELAYFDIEEKSCRINCSLKKMEELLSWADIITLHLSNSSEGSPVLGEKELSLMKKDSWLVNVSRGGVVDEKALDRCLKNGHLKGAAIDVFEKEPYEGPLKEHDNVILTPHIGSYAKEARIGMEIEAVENLIRELKERGDK